MSTANALRLVALTLIAASCGSAETLTVRSGNGAIGGTDNAVHFLLGPATGGFGHTFTAADFSNAPNGPAAFILSPNAAWVTGLSVDASAKWIGTNPSAAVSSGNTALYAISFQITNPFSTATLTLNYSVDDGIGDSSNSGVYVNGLAVCGNSFPSEFHQEHLVTCNVSPQLRMGTNLFYIEDGNAEGPAGLLFSATITTATTQISIPEIISISPASPVASPNNQTVTVYGNGFQSGLIVYIGWMIPPVAPSGGQIQNITPTSFQMTLPLASTGNWSIQVVNPDGDKSNVFTFVVNLPTPQSNPQPSIISLSPPSAQAGSGPLTLTINGSGFIPVSSVTFNGVSHPVSFVNGNLLTLTLSRADLALPGTLAVVVSNPSPGGGTSNGINFTVSVAVPTITSVTSSATELSGSISPGEIVSIYGTDLGPTNALKLQLDINGNAATSLGGVQVFFSGTAAPLAYVSSSQINAVVPYQITGILNPTMYITYAGQTSNQITLTSAPSAPGLFTQNGSGTGPGAILNADDSFNSPNNPAAQGSYVLLYLTGEGQTLPPGVTGKVTTLSMTPPLTPQPVLPVTASIGGQTANIAFYGEAPGLVSGVLQINAQIPPNTAPGNIAVQVSIGDAISNTVTVAVAPPPNPPPLITGLSPTSTQAGSAPLTLSINGSGFIPASSVTFNGASHPVSFVSASQLTITLGVSDLATAGNFPVVVINPPPGGGSSNIINLTITAALNPQPSIASLSPASAQAGSGPLTLTINGIGLISASTVTFNSVPHSSTFVNSSQLAITLNAADLAVTGSFAVVVTNPPPGGGTSNIVQFTTTNPPPVSLTGTWQGAWGSVPSGLYGPLSANLTQTGTQLTGTISLTDSPCFAVGSVMGTVTSNMISASATFPVQQQMSLAAAVDATGASITDGAYVVINGTCFGDYGIFTLKKTN